MGHLLASLNPEAAEAFNQGTAQVPAPLPPIGSVVEYVMREGHSRMGRNRFPAFVMGKSLRGDGLDLLVFIDAGDFVDEQLVQRAQPGNESHCWDWLQDASGALHGLRQTMASMHQRIGEAEDRLKAIEGVVLGDFDAPRISIIAIMQDFENRLRIAAGASVAGNVPRGAGAKRGPKKGAKKSTKRK